MNEFVTHRGMDCLVVHGITKSKSRALYSHARRYSLLVDRVADERSKYSLYFPVLAAGREATAKVVSGLLKVVS